MMSFRTLLVAAAAALSLSPALAPAFAEEHPKGLHVHDAYARSMGGIGASGAVFFMIHNNGETNLRIVGARADVAQKVELHTHTMTADGVMQMTEIEGGVPLMAGAMHAFERGGDHVMLMGLTRELKDGDVVPVTLVMEDGTEFSFDAVVDNARKPGDAGTEGHDHSGHDHSGHGAPADDQSGMAEGGHDHSAHGHGAAAMAPDTTGMSDADAIVTILKAQFDTPDNPLTVDPVVVEGDHALASWAQGGTGGRALLERREGAWVIVLCGGKDLRMPTFLADHGVTAAETLSTLYNAAEEALGAEKVALSSSFEGVVMVAGPLP